MRAEDILWGGNNKCEFALQRNISLSEGMIVDIYYNYTSEQYYLKSQGEECAIVLEEYSKNILDGIYLTGTAYATLVRIVDRDEDENTYIAEVKVFHQKIQFSSLQAMEIQIGDSIVEKMRIRDKGRPIEALEEAFKFGDMIFVKSYARDGASFTVLSNDRYINVRQEKGRYVAVNYVPYHKENADYETVYILQGNVKFVDSSNGARISNEVERKMSKITQGGEYFDVWEAYNELDGLFAMKLAGESGVLEYTGYECKLKDAFEYCFTLKDNAEPFPFDSLIECTDDDTIKLITSFSDIKQMSQLRQIKRHPIGTFSRIEGNKCYIIDRESSARKKIPNKGFLTLSMSGDAVRLSRREKAKSDILTGEAPIGCLAEMIESGAELNKKVIDETPITKALERKFPDYSFNDEQREAIRVAINTPDIALILGPPGTGKTTVIKAIIARYEEYFHKYNQDIPKILITSFQHEAVENVIVGVDGNGVPSDRRGGRKDGKDKQTISMVEWRQRTNQKLTSRISELLPEGFEEGNPLRDKIYAWKEKGKDPTEGIELLKESFEGYRLRLSKELNDEINNVISRASVGNKSSEIIKSIALENDSEISEILYSQRLTQDAYADDGKKNAFRLKYAIFEGQIDNGGNTDFIDDLIASKGKDSVVFEKYVSEVKRLIEKYIGNADNKTAVSDISTIEQCLKRVSGELEEARRSRLENRNEAIAWILHNYLESIQDEKEIEKIVGNYSNVVAATCQQAMEVGRNARHILYDLVIVDEAARANPLDLLIPMSMGKKIVLVGDHKQLPHMLDPEVVKTFEKDEKMNDLGVLQESLFERLYRMYDSSQMQIKRTARLSKQYRMHPSIGEYASSSFYKEYPLDSSRVDIEVKKANLSGKYNDCPMAWINLDKNTYGLEEGGRSKFRPKEAEVIIDEIREIFKLSPDKKIGIISFYRQQAELIKRMAETEFSDSQNDQIEIGTVDAFQGKEFDIVFLSCVRANIFGLDEMRKRVGHVNDMSRLCVSFTRAKQLVVAVGDRDTIECVEPIAEFIKVCEKGGSYIG